MKVKVEIIPYYKRLRDLKPGDTFIWYNPEPVSQETVHMVCSVLQTAHITVRDNDMERVVVVNCDSGALKCVGNLVKVIPCPTVLVNDQ